MKKSIVVLLIAMMAMMLILAGCSHDEGDGGKDDGQGGDKTDSDKVLPLKYDGVDLTQYVTVPDYNVYTTSEPKVEISEEDVDEEIEKRLAAVPVESTEAVKVDKGDTVHVAYKGTLEDGTTKDGMNSDDFKMTLGVTSMIDGFNEGLYGATVGETVTLDLQFPDSYPQDTSLEGKKVTFEVTVKSKEVPSELNEAFVKENSEAATIEEYRELVRKDLEDAEREEQLMDLKSDIWGKISSEAEVIAYPDGLEDEWKEFLDNYYHSIATQYGYGEDEWETFLTDGFQMDQAEFDEQVKLLAQIRAKQEILVYAVAQKEGLTLTQGEFDEYLAQVLEDNSIPSAEVFEALMGVSLSEYATDNKMDADALLEKELDLIYDRLEKK